jgi:DNA-binding response OmpR family regulator
VSQTILIADVDPERAARLSELCTQRGFSTRSVANGALALEVALADAPDLVVADFGLDLITGAQLAEILRANPRTRGVRFVFLGDRPDRAPPNDLDSDVIPTPIDEAEVVRRIERLLQRPARLNEIDRAQGEGNPLSGQLDQVALPDLLQLFHVNRRTGTVEVVQRERKGREQRGVIYVRDGNVIQAIAGTVDGEKALFRLLGWKTGSFAFTPDRAPVEARIETPTRALLMEGLRQLDEWESLRGSLPARDARVALRVTSSALPNMVHPLTQEVLLLLEIYTRVQDVVDSCAARIPTTRCCARYRRSSIASSSRSGWGPRSRRPRTRDSSPRRTRGGCASGSRAVARATARRVTRRCCWSRRIPSPRWTS